MRNSDYNCGLREYYVGTEEQCYSVTHDVYLKEYYDLQEPYPWSKYCWKPKDCEAEPFSPVSFCRKLHGRRILLVGDSLLYQFYIAFIFQLGLPPDVHIALQAEEQFGEVTPLCRDLGGGGVVFIRNDDWRVEGECTSGCVYHPWKNQLLQTDIVIMNKGHHINKKEHGELYLKATTAALEYIKRSVPSSQRLDFFFMTTSPGHGHCFKDAQPIMLPVKSERDFDSLQKEYMHRIPRETISEGYGWENYPVHDKHIMSLVRNIVNGSEFDIVPMTYLRPDGHRFVHPPPPSALDEDCLHYSLPAVVDNWVFMFFNIMRI